MFFDLIMIGIALSDDLSLKECLLDNLVFDSNLSLKTFLGSKSKRPVPLKNVVTHQVSFVSLSRSSTPIVPHRSSLRLRCFAADSGVNFSDATLIS